MGRRNVNTILLNMSVAWLISLEKNWPLVTEKPNQIKFNKRNPWFNRLKTKPGYLMGITRRAQIGVLFSRELLKKTPWLQEGDIHFAILGGPELIYKCVQREFFVQKGSRHISNMCIVIDVTTYINCEEKKNTYTLLNCN